MQQTEKYWNLINRIVLIAVGIMAAVGVVLAFTPKVKQMHDYQNIVDNKQQRIDIAVSTVQETKDNIRRFKNDPDFVEKVAHEVGYAHKDETIFRFHEETGTY